MTDSGEAAASTGAAPRVTKPEANPRDNKRDANPRVYKPEMPRGWWLRRRHYFLYMIREFTAVPMAAWLIWFLYEIRRAGNGPKGYYPPSSPAFIAFSVICLGFAVYHSYTFLSLAGVIMHIKLMGKPVPPRTIVAAMFGLWLVASVVIAAVLIGFAR